MWPYIIVRLAALSNSVDEFWPLCHRVSNRKIVQIVGSSVETEAQMQKLRESKVKVRLLQRDHLGRPFSNNTVTKLGDESHRANVCKAEEHPDSVYTLSSTLSR